MVVLKDLLTHPSHPTLNFQGDWAEQARSQASWARTSFLPLLPICSTPPPHPSPAATWRSGAEDARAWTLRLSLACEKESRAGQGKELVGGRLPSIPLLFLAPSLHLLSRSQTP